MSGGSIPKVYKQKNGKYIIYLPYEVVNALNLKEDDELDFFKFGSNSFIMAKKEDIAALLSRGMQNKAEQMQAGYELGNKEISVLKKLDTLRYNMRNRQNVEKILNDDEKKILGNLMKRNIVKLYSKEEGKPELYSISKEIYDRFLMRKKAGGGEREEKEEEVKSVDAGLRRGALGSNLEKYGLEQENVKRLEEKGYLVVPTEAEAASISLALEESIRQGMVLGIRAFNKKFYIMLRPFFEKYSMQIVKMLEGGEAKVEDVAKRLGIDEEAARGILYLLAESGDVSEKKRDLFVLI
ncbi:MAG: hypothetical protein ACP5HW_02295 [Candidatus Micrarchaeia archaeon]